MEALKSGIVKDMMFLYSNASDTQLVIMRIVPRIREDMLFVFNIWLEWETQLYG